MGLIQAQIDGVEPPSNSQQGNEDISEGLTERFSRWMNSMGEWAEAELIADLPRQTWIPAALLDEWPLTRPNRGIITDNESITDLVTLLESVCGPLNGEVLGWQRVPEMDMANLCPTHVHRQRFAMRLDPLESSQCLCLMGPSLAGNFS